MLCIFYGPLLSHKLIRTELLHLDWGLILSVSGTRTNLFHFYLSHSELIYELVLPFVLNLTHLVAELLLEGLLPLRRDCFKLSVHEDKCCVSVPVLRELRLNVMTAWLLLLLLLLLIDLHLKLTVILPLLHFQ